MLILFVHRTCRPREPSRDPERRARRHARGVGRDPFVSRRSPLNETAVSLHTHESHTVLHTRCYTHHVTQNTRSTTLCYTMCSVAVWLACNTSALVPSLGAWTPYTGRDA